MKKKSGTRNIIRKDSDPLNLSGKQKPWLNGDDESHELVVDNDEEEDSLVGGTHGGGASAASSLEEEQYPQRSQPPLIKEGGRSNSMLTRKNTPFPEDLKPKGKGDKKTRGAAPNSSNAGGEGVFDELELVEEDEGVDDDDIVARIEGTPKKKKKKPQRAQTISARPLTPEGKFRAEHSADHPFAGGKGQYARESAAGRQRLVPGKHRNRAPPSAPERLAEVMSRQEQKKHDLQRQLEGLRKHQNQALLEVLEDERQAEEERTGLARGVSDTKERNRYRGHVMACVCVFVGVVMCCDFN